MNSVPTHGSRLNAFLGRFDREVIEVLRRDRDRNGPSEVGKLRAVLDPEEGLHVHKKDDRSMSHSGEGNSELTEMTDAQKAIHYRKELLEMQEVVRHLSAQLSLQTRSVSDSAIGKGRSALDGTMARRYGVLTRERSTATTTTLGDAMGRPFFNVPECRCSERRRFAHHACLRFLILVFRCWKRRKDCMRRMRHFTQLYARRWHKLRLVCSLQHWIISLELTRRLRNLSLSSAARCLAKIYFAWCFEISYVAQKRRCNLKNHYMRMNGEIVSNWRASALRKAAARQRRELYLQRLQCSMISTWHSFTAMHTKAALAIRRVEAALASACVVAWRLDSVGKQAACHWRVTTWHKRMCHQESATDIRVQGLQGWCTAWVRWVKVKRRSAVLVHRLERKVQREVLRAWVRRRYQVLRARTLHEGQSMALTASICSAWSCAIRCIQLARCAAEVVRSEHLRHWRRVTGCRKRALQLLRAIQRRLAHLLWRTWCRYVQRVAAAQELARGIRLVELTRIAKCWHKYAVAWRPVRCFRHSTACRRTANCRCRSFQRWREFCQNRRFVLQFVARANARLALCQMRQSTGRWTERARNRRIVSGFCAHKIRVRFVATFSCILSSWSAEAVWQKALAVHAEFVNIERKSKPDAPILKRWVAYSNWQRRMRAIVDLCSQQTRRRLLDGACTWWRSWTSLCAVVKTARAKLGFEQIFQVWHVWLEEARSTRRELEFFVAYRKRANLRKAFQALKWDNHRVACLVRAKAEFDRRHLQTDFFSGWAQNVQSARETGSLQGKSRPKVAQSPQSFHPSSPFSARNISSSSKVSYHSSPQHQGPPPQPSTARSLPARSSWGSSLSPANLSSSFSTALETARSSEVMSRVINVGALGLGAGSHLSLTTTDDDKKTPPAGTLSARTNGFTFGGPGWSG
jgi:hypothetical protein